MKRHLALLLSIMMLCSTLSGCTNWDDTAVENPFRELSEYYRSENEDVTLMPVTAFTLPYFSGETLDPLTCPDGVHLTLGALLYEGLYRLDTQFTPYNALAQSAAYDSAQHAYTIRLKPDARFSDGSTVTADDIVSSLLRAKDSARYGGRLSDVRSIESIDGAVVITLMHGNRHFLSRLDIPILKAGTEADTVPVGSGLYCWAVDENGPYLARNDYNERSAALPLARIELTACRNVDAATYAFYTREVQLLTCDLTATASGSIDGDPIDVDTPILLYLGFHFHRAPLADAAVRQALNLAIDRREIVSAYLLGHGKAAQFPVSPAYPLYPAELEKDTSSDAFAAAMSSIGLNTGEDVYPLTLLVNEESRFKTAIAQEIANRCSACDLQITVQALPWEAYCAALAAGDFDLYLGECKLTADWDLSAFLAQGGAMNFGGWEDPDTEALLAAWLESSGEQEETAMTALCKAWQQQLPILPLCFKASSVLVSEGVVENLIPTADPFYNMEDWLIRLEEPTGE